MKAINGTKAISEQHARTALIRQLAPGSRPAGRGGVGLRGASCWPRAGRGVHERVDNRRRRDRPAPAPARPAAPIAELVTGPLGSDLTWGVASGGRRPRWARAVCAQLQPARAGREVRAELVTAARTGGGARLLVGLVRLPTRPRARPQALGDPLEASPQRLRHRPSTSPSTDACPRAAG